MSFRAAQPMAAIVLVAGLAVGLGACAASDDDDDQAEPDVVDRVVQPIDIAPENAGDSEQPDSSPAGGALSVGSTWQWQLQGDINTTYDVDVYDIDLFDTPDSTFDVLRADGRVVICYFSAGSYEDWRPDADGFAAADLGSTLDGFDDERWLDVRSATVRSVVEGRLDLAVDRGCDGVEPDNVDGDTDSTGFDLTAGDLIDFNRFVADAARQRGLLVGLKNSGDQVVELVDHFDFAVNEQCHEYDECAQFDPFLARGKPVFNAEYLEEFVDDPDRVCEPARARGIRTLILPLDLDDSFRISCV